MRLRKISNIAWLSSLRQIVVVTSILLSLCANLLAEQTPPAEKPSTAVSQSTPEAPKLSEIIPLAAGLTARLTELKNITPDLPDLAKIKRDYSEIDQQITEVSENIKHLQKMRMGQNARGMRLRLNFAYEKDRLSKTSQPLDLAIEQLADDAKQWQIEKQQWAAWRSSFQDRPFDQILAAFDKADATITSALAFIAQEMDPLLTVQSIGAHIKAKIDGLEAETAALQAAALRGPRFGKAPPMYSPDYYAQFNSDLWAVTWENLKFIPRPGKEFFSLHALELGVLVFSIIVLMVVMFRKRQAIAESESWSFVAERPFAVVLFITSLIASVQMQYWASPSDMVTTFVMFIGSMSCLRLLLEVLKSPWARMLSAGVMSLFAVTILLIMVDLPSPIFNLIILLASTVALVFSLKLAGACRTSKDGLQPLWTSRALALWFAVILIAEILGDTGIAYAMFVNSVITMAVIALIVFFIYLLRGCIHWIFYSSPLWQIKLLRSDAQKNERKVQIIVETVITIFLILPSTLSVWGVFDSFPDALNGIFSPGFEVGDHKITIGLIIAALAVLYGSFYVSQFAPKILLDEQVLGRQMDRGVRGSIGHLLRYLIIFIGLLVTFSLLGFGLTNITIILSALGVGIGFGLQGIVNNFVSGLILLFERPIREGDIIELDSQWAEVKRIGMRATIIQTYDLSELVIPNADMISNHVTNWTLSNRQIRLTIPVGVSYGSDITLVGETILACAKGNELVLKSPTPEVLFLNLGDSSLDFKLRVWINDADNILVVKSQLYHEIFQAFREKGISIPFPQRDVHLYPVGNAEDESLKPLPGKDLNEEGDPA